MAASLNNSAWLEWMTALMGGVSRQTHAATFPLDRFYCLLDELPLHLLPQQSRSLLQAQDHDDKFYLNPDCVVRRAEDLPEELIPHRELFSAFALQGKIAWVRDSAAGSLRPFWLGPNLDELLGGLRPGEPVPSSFPGNERSILATAGILISQPGEGERRKCRTEMLNRAALHFDLTGYTPLSSLIHPFHVAALRRYYRYLIRTGEIPLGDRQSPRRYAAYKEPVACFFHHQIAPVLSAVAGQALKPSYVYLASYLSGAELKKHTDREQCEFSITLCLDFSPEPALETPWPISLDTPKGATTVYQAIGDGLAYRGTKLPHYRAPLAEGQTSTSIFFHYVPFDFMGRLE
jgi:hypothetical protein